MLGVLDETFSINNNKINDSLMRPNITYLPKGLVLSNQYEIIEPLGSGGFGKTYKVKDLLGNIYVIKEFFLSDRCTRNGVDNSVSVSESEGNQNKRLFEEQLEKFKREAICLNNLSHPNVVKVLALFPQNGTFYYVMEYIDGMSLKDVCAKNNLSEEKIMQYLKQLLDALDYIHKQGVSHLDIKPGNIMIDKNDRLVLIDFGASKLFNSSSENKTMMTSNRPPFTPGYAPIEQENGNVEDIGPHSDIYALGATLFYMYTGHNPGTPYQLFESGFSDMPNASPLMQSTIKKAMAFWRKDRIQSVAEFRTMLNGDDAVTQIELSSKKNDVTVVDNSVQTRIISNIYEAEDKKESPYVFNNQDEQVAISPKKNVINLLTSKVAVLVGSLAIVIIIVVALLVPSKNNIGGNNSESSATYVSGELNSENNIEESNNITDENVKENVPKPFNTFTETVNGVRFKMIAVEGGSFEMGAISNHHDESNDDEVPLHQVTLSNYYIGEVEVTQELWKAVMGNNPSHYKNAKNPVEQVSWTQCQEFVKKLNKLTNKQYSLPTEAQWEYAARGGQLSKNYMYSGSDNLNDVAWYGAYEDESIKQETHNVALKQPNELGLYDMSGNVHEWCLDWYGDYPNSSQVNPKGPSGGEHRVMRGGNWYRKPVHCRVSSRNHSKPSYTNRCLGFRLVLIEED